ncbi:MAG: hypothetical protein ACYTG4_05235 [Planctomycetota bacterium]
MRFMFLKVTIVILELVGALALLGGVALVIMALQAFDGAVEVSSASLTVGPDTVVTVSDEPLLRFWSLAPGIGGVLMGTLMLGVGQLGEAVLHVEKMIRKDPPKDE